MISVPFSWDLEGFGPDTSLSMNYWIDDQGNIIIDYDLSVYPSAQEQNLTVHISSDFYGVMLSEGIIDPVSQKGRSMIKIPKRFKLWWPTVTILTHKSIFTLPKKKNGT